MTHYRALLGSRLILVVLCLFGVFQTAQAAPPGHVDVLISYKKWPVLNDLTFIRNQGGAVRRSFSRMPVCAATIPQAALNLLAKNPNVLLVEPDVEIHAIGYQDELNNVWGVEHIESDYAFLHNPTITGAQVKVAVIDSGIDIDHPDLAATYAGGYDFVNNDNNPDDDNGHGTHCAGTIAGVADGQGVVGVAPGVQLYALKVLDRNGSGSFSDVIAALEWCIDNGIHVTSNSYGSDGDPGFIVEQAFIDAYEAGILNVAAAGNSGDSSGTGNNVGYPARYNSVIAVAAVNKSNSRPSFSSTGPAVEVSAPGTQIYSTLPNNDYGSYSGTSMACPHTAGMAALLIQAGLDASLSIDNRGVRQLLADSCIDLGDSGRDSLYGYGLINVTNGINLIEAGLAPPAAVEPELMRVSAIRFKLVRNNRDMIVRVFITSESGEPVVGARVSVFLKARGNPYGSFTKLTNINGVAIFRVNNAVRGYWRVSVTDVTADGYVWDGVDPNRLYRKR